MQAAYFCSAKIVQATGEGKDVTIYTANGALVEKIESYKGEEIVLNKGVYILRVRDKAVKMMLLFL